MAFLERAPDSQHVRPLRYSCGSAESGISLVVWEDARCACSHTTNEINMTHQKRGSMMERVMIRSIMLPLFSVVYRWVLETLEVSAVWGVAIR